MSAAQNMNVYLNNHYEGMTPEKLIHMLYQGALKHLGFARQGLIEKDPKKRGEHLGKVISIISELNTSINPEVNDESTQFLRGLYASMLAELPKVSITNDVKTIDITCSYLKKLNEIWENEVLNNKGKKAGVKANNSGASQPTYGNRYSSGNVIDPKSIFA
ncbi:MAG: flagellar export chaperone FliS [Deltaproteobacteria bacterium]|nr:MAG: flagellar export chaperone FliS [Deltaproteobacteria bacterium]